MKTLRLTAILLVLVLIVSTSPASADISFSVLNGGMVPMSSVKDGVSTELSRINEWGDMQWVGSCWYNGSDVGQGCTYENGQGWYWYETVYLSDGTSTSTPLRAGEYYLSVWARGTMITRLKFNYDGVSYQTEDVVLEYSPVQATVVGKTLIDIPEEGGAFRSSMNIWMGPYSEGRTVKVQHMVSGSAENWFSTQYGLGEKTVTLAKGLKIRVQSPLAEVSAGLPVGGWTCILTQVSDEENANIVFASLQTCARKVKRTRLPIR